jgi:hypothetical protein
MHAVFRLNVELKKSPYRLIKEVNYAQTSLDKTILNFNLTSKLNILTIQNVVY